MPRRDELRRAVAERATGHGRVDRSRLTMLVINEAVRKPNPDAAVERHRVHSHATPARSEMVETLADEVGIELHGHPNRSLNIEELRAVIDALDEVTADG